MKLRSEIPTIIIELRGDSTPEDANYFYFPLLEVLETLIKTDLKFVFNFKFHHYNTVSTRYISSIMELFKPYVNNGRVTLNWYYLGTFGDYRNYDEDLKELGEDYKQALKIKMNILERKMDLNDI